MEFLVVLVVLVLVGLALAGWAGFALFRHGERTRRRAEWDAPAILDAAFDGRDDVVFKVNLETPSPETVILGAKERGYRLTSQRQDSASGAAQTLMFERAVDRSR